MLATSLARLDSIHLAWGLDYFEYIHTLQALSVRQVKELLPTQYYRGFEKSLLERLSLICNQTPQSVGLRQLRP